jgi:alkylhydroperoxidase family enzyme
MSDDTKPLREAVVKNVLEAPATASTEARRAAYANAGVEATRAAFVDKVTKAAYKVTDEDVAALKAAGIADDEIFELAVCAALGEATRQLDAAMSALDAAHAEKQP